MSISEGGSQLPAIDETGAVWSRGSNSYGERGDGTISGPGDVPTSVWAPVTVLPAGVRVVAVSASRTGPGFSLALDADGGVWAWGADPYGELGDGGTDAFLAEPTLAIYPTLPAGTRITAIEAGDYHGLALDDNHQVWGWGLNGSGQLGYDAEIGYLSSQLPLVVPDLGPISAIAVGDQCSIALGTDGSVSAFGDPYAGCLGTAAEITPGAPVHPAGLDGVTITAISGGVDFVLALDAGGHMWSWGSSNLGRLGRPVSNLTELPAEVAFDDGGNPVTIRAIEAGDFSGAAIDASGRVWTWGTGDVLGLIDPLGGVVATAASPMLLDTTVNPGADMKVARVELGDAFGDALPAMFTADAPPPNGRVGQAYAGFQFESLALGSANYLLGSGGLPPGLSLSAGGALAGTPTTVGDFTFAVMLTDEAGAMAATGSITIHIDPAAQPPVFHGDIATHPRHGRCRLPRLPVHRHR